MAQRFSRVFRLQGINLTNCINCQGNMRINNKGWLYLIILYKLCLLKVPVITVTVLIYNSFCFRSWLCSFAPSSGAPTGLHFVVLQDNRVEEKLCSFFFLMGRLEKLPDLGLSPNFFYFVPLTSDKDSFLDQTLASPLCPLSQQASTLAYKDSNKH